MRRSYQDLLVERELGDRPLQPRVLAIQLLAATWLVVELNCLSSLFTAKAPGSDRIAGVVEQL
jgi:hypothetical protein